MNVPWTVLDVIRVLLWVILGPGSLGAVAGLIQIWIEDEEPMARVIVIMIGVGVLGLLATGGF